MESFEELGVAPELVEVLFGAGIEHPTKLQRDLIPLLRRGNNALVRAGPGAGTLVGYGVPLIERIPAESTVPRAAVLTASTRAAESLAESLARLSLDSGHSVAALGSNWASPEACDILFATPRDLLRAVRTSLLRLEKLRALVVDGAAAIQLAHGLEDLNALVAFLPANAQRVVISLPVTPEVRAFARAHARKAGHVPGDAVSVERPPDPVRGVVRYRICRKTDADILGTVSDILEKGAHRLLVFRRSDDYAADVGDLISLHGFRAGAPGDASTRVWVRSDDTGGGPPVPPGSVHPGSLSVLSIDVPADIRSLEHRHGFGASATVLVQGRELAHLKDVATRGGYGLEPLPHRPSSESSTKLEQRRNELLAILKEEDLSAEILLLEPLFERYDPVEVAAAATRMAGGPQRSNSEHSARSHPRKPTAKLPARAQAWVRLFMSVGSQDGVRPGDLLGAVAGEARIDRSNVGKIEIHEQFSRVEVREQVAEKVVHAVSGTTLGGRSVRVDYHRESGRRKPTRSPGFRRRIRSPRRKPA